MCISHGRIHTHTHTHLILALHACSSFLWEAPLCVCVCVAPWWRWTLAVTPRDLGFTSLILIYALIHKERWSESTLNIQVIIMAHP